MNHAELREWIKSLKNVMRHDRRDIRCIRTDGLMFSPRHGVNQCHFKPQTLTFIFWPALGTKPRALQSSILTSKTTRQSSSTSKWCSSAKCCMKFIFHKSRQKYEFPVPVPAPYSNHSCSCMYFEYPTETMDMDFFRIKRSLCPFQSLVYLCAKHQNCFNGLGKIKFTFVIL